MAIDSGDVHVTINSVELSAQCTSAPAIEQAREEVDITAMGDAIRKMQATIESAPELTFTFKQSFASGNVHLTLQPLFEGATEVNVAMRPVNTTVASTNPEFQFTGVVTRYNPMDGTQPGNIILATCTIRRTSAITVDDGS